MLVSAFRASVVSQGDRMAVGLVCRAHRNKSKQPRFRDSFAFRGSGIAGERSLEDIPLSRPEKPRSMMTSKLERRRVREQLFSRYAWL